MTKLTASSSDSSSNNKRVVGATSEHRETQQPLRLLIHAVDGAVPYLTPTLLQECFPSEKYSDILWIGMAVRDTCVVPYFSQDKLLQKGKIPKPSGYTFSTNVRPDPWLLKYTRITVPTFDPVQDALRFSPQKTTDSLIPNASDKHVYVWTENGRQSLTPEMYYNAAIHGLQSHSTVALFDVCLPEATQRRKRAAQQRTNRWNAAMIENQSENSAPRDNRISSPKVWASYMVSPTNQDNEGEKPREAEHQLTMLQEALNTHKISGITFVGWQYASDSEGQRILLREAIQSIQHVVNADLCPILAVLCTGSLTQFLDAASLGINVIGCNLPATWAKSMCAFVCDFEDWQTMAHKRRKIEKKGFPKGSLDKDGCFHVLSRKSEDDEGTWIRDTEPLLPGCSCFTCKRHSRSYIYHLVMTKELLAEILLFIHNLHHMLGFCQEFSIAAKEDKHNEFCKHIQDQLASDL